MRGFDVIVTVVLLLLCGKWIFTIMYYPLMSLSAYGKRCNNVAARKAFTLPLKACEHFLRFGGGDLCCLTYPRCRLCIYVNGCIKAWAQD